MIAVHTVYTVGGPEILQESNLLPGLLRFAVNDVSGNQDQIRFLPVNQLHGLPGFIRPHAGTEMRIGDLDYSDKPPGGAGKSFVKKSIFVNFRGSAGIDVTGNGQHHRHSGKHRIQVPEGCRTGNAAVGYFPEKPAQMNAECQKQGDDHRYVQGAHPGHHMVGGLGSNNAGSSGNIGQKILVAAGKIDSKEKIPPFPGQIQRFYQKKPGKRHQARRIYDK